VAADIASTVTARMRLGVSHGMRRVCNQVRRPLAADAPTIAQPTHMIRKIALPEERGAA
jgi:hypothetical protein